jgi:hypothetical protein
LAANSNFEKALFNAERSIKLCPEFLKGHSRKIEALRRIAKIPSISRGTEIIEAKELARVVNIFEQLSRIHATIELSLANIHWINFSMFGMYQEARWHEGMRRIREECCRESRPSIIIKASLVPFMNLPFCMVTLKFPSDNFTMNRWDCMSMHVVDDKDARLLESPPNGISSVEACKKALYKLTVCAYRLLNEEGITQIKVELGQGLIMHHGLVKKVFSEFNIKYGTTIRVENATSTYAAEKAAGFG